jgi:ribosome-binding factor A
MSFHKEKVIELISHTASEFIKRESNRNSLITVTNVTASDDLKYSNIFFTVLPENQEQAALDFLKRNRSEFKKFFKEKSRVNHIPFFDFLIDEGEKHRQKIDEISRNL